MTELVNLGDYRKAKMARQRIENYLEYLKLLHLPELLHEAKRLLKKIQLKKISQSTAGKGKAMAVELLSRIKKREGRTCESLKHLQNQLMILEGKWTSFDHKRQGL